jgi:hypothetical protein
MIESRGFKKIEHKYTNFYFIPHPLDHLFPSTYMKLSEYVDRHGYGDKMQNLAVNYIALYQKV